MTTVDTDSRAPERVDGYAPIRDYAVIGNKRTAALVALDGSIDWLCLPDFAGPSVFAGLLDARGGGGFRLSPAVPFRVSRRYVPDTNVLETTFHTEDGTVTITDGMVRPIARGLVWNQIVRRVEATAAVPMEWEIAPRFDYGAVALPPREYAGVPAFVHGSHVLAVEAHGVGTPEATATAVRGAFTTRPDEVAVLALSAFHDEPITLSGRDHLLQRLDATVERWQRWLADCSYDGAWADAVRRSALALDLLVDEQSGAIAAAATMGLPERIGGSRNYDYRYSWLRDTNLTLGAMERLGFRDQVHVSLAWMFRALRRTRPRLRVMYRLDGGPRIPDRELPLPGYRGSRPVTLGNSAQNQLQLGNFGDVFDMAYTYIDDSAALQPQAARELADSADYLCRIWRRPDASIWELSDRRDYTQGKLAAWLALTHAAELAESGTLPGGRSAAWRREAERIRRYIHEHCWSQTLRSYSRARENDELDAAVLLATRGSFLEDEPERLAATTDAIRRQLSAGGPLVYRFTGAHEFEGAFVACSFWVVEALARVGRLDDAASAMDELVGLQNDVGLYSEEIDPVSGAFLGNLPQALSHLALVNAATTLSDAERAPGRSR
jgi:GH15 family glucan-1,4-alpha-glucosidase